MSLALGFVNGKMQTHLHMRPTGKPSQVWRHDIFRNDHTPYDDKELSVFRDAIRQSVVGGKVNEERPKADGRGEAP